MHETEHAYLYAERVIVFSIENGESTRHVQGLDPAESNLATPPGAAVFYPYSIRFFTLLHRKPLGKRH
jgi:hypothetical protein